jgi:hypothetical protein
MTESEKQTELDNLISILKSEGMAYPKTSGNLCHGDFLDRVLADCRRLVAVARHSSNATQKAKN